MNDNMWDKVDNLDEELRTWCKDNGDPAQLAACAFQFRQLSNFLTYMSIKKGQRKVETIMGKDQFKVKCCHICVEFENELVKNQPEAVTCCCICTKFTCFSCITKCNSPYDCKNHMCAKCWEEHFIVPIVDWTTPEPPEEWTCHVCIKTLRQQREAEILGGYGEYN